MFTPGVDLLVVDHQTPPKLRRMLASIHDEDHPLAVWIGLVDSPESQGIARDFHPHTGHPGEVKNWVENVGYNRAINRLGTLGTHEIIACCNSDIEFRPGVLTELAQATWTHPDWGVVGPRQTDDRHRLSAGGIFGTSEKPRHRGWRATEGYEDIRDDAVYVAGSVVFMRRTVWDELTNCPDYRAVCDEPGPWLDVQHFYGDAWLSAHARAHGYKAVYYGATTVTHSVGARRISQRDKADKARFRAACDAHEIPHE
jgi:GT2 family glycosyltransferase